MTSLLIGPRPAEFFPPVCLTPLMGVSVPAGFPSPADDWSEDRVDLNQKYIQNPDATFFFTVSGDSMEGPDASRSIPNGAMLVVDRAIEAEHGMVVVAVIDSDFTVKRLYNRGGRIALVPENPAYPRIIIGEQQELQIWGVVTSWLMVTR